jgi:hypothetical protein
MFQVGLTVSKTEELFKEAGVIRLEKTVLQIVGQEDILVFQNIFVRNFSLVLMALVTVFALMAFDRKSFV